MKFHMSLWRSDFFKNLHSRVHFSISFLKFGTSYVLNLCCSKSKREMKSSATSLTCGRNWVTAVGRIIIWLTLVRKRYHSSPLLWTKQYLKTEFAFLLFKDTWPQWGHSVSYVTMLFPLLANHQDRHQATSKMGCQPGDCMWPLQFSPGVCTVMYMYGRSRTDSLQ